MADTATRIEALVRAGGAAALSAPAAGLDPAFDGHDWDPVTISGDNLRELLLRIARDHEGVQVRVRGVRVAGRCDLAWTDLPLVLDFERCLFTGPLWLNDATIRSVRLAECVVGGVDAARLSSSQLLAHRSLFVGRLSLSAARLGRLELTDSTILVESPDAPEDSRATLAIDGNVVETDRSTTLNGKGFLCIGRARFIGAGIGGQLSCREGTFVRRAVLAATLEMGIETDVLSVLAERLTRLDVRARELVRRYGIAPPWVVSENPSMAETRPSRRDGDLDPCLSVHEATITRSMYLHDAWCVGRVNLSAARLGRLEGRSARLLNPGGTALDGSNAVTDRDLDLSSATIAGHVKANGAHVGRDLDLAAARLVAAPPASEHLVSLVGCRVDLDLTARGLTVTGQTSPPAHAVRLLDLADAVVGSALTWERVSLLDGRRHEVRLTHASVGRLADDPTSWNGVAVQLEGFRARTMSFEGDVGLAWRRRWLSDNAEPYVPHAYEQIAALAREHGREADARTLLIASERDRRRRGGLSFPSRAWSAVLDVTVGYGHRSSRALAVLVVLWVLGAGLYTVAWRGDVIHHDATSDEARCPDDAACFQPVVFSLDTLIPVISLGQDDAWHVTAQARHGWTYELFQWVQIIVGWVLTTAVVAGAGRVLQRR